MPVDLFGGYADSLPRVRRRGTERKCWRRRMHTVEHGMVPVVW